MLNNLSKDLRHYFQYYIKNILFVKISIFFSRIDDYLWYKFKRGRLYYMTSLVEEYFGMLKNDKDSEDYSTVKYSLLKPIDFDSFLRYDLDWNKYENYDNDYDFYVFFSDGKYYSHYCAIFQKDQIEEALKNKPDYITHIVLVEYNV